MVLVGLTGGIASGKSTVSQRFSEVYGFPVIDADKVARAVVEPGQPALAEIEAHFGSDVIGDDGALDRPVLGRIVFADDEQRQVLNDITHPRIAEEMGHRIQEFVDHDGPVVVDSPLLVEMGHSGMYPVIVVVATSPETQHRRLVGMRDMDPEEAWGRINSQAPLQDKLDVATHVIHNDGTLDDLLAQIDAVAQVLMAAS